VAGEVLGGGGLVAARGVEADQVARDREHLVGQCGHPATPSRSSTHASTSAS
jgi:hypothetical protein